MAVKIRLTRVGTTNAPMYRIIAIDSRSKRDGKALDILGAYNPKTGEILKFDMDRVDKWVSQGAMLSDTVRKLKKQYTKQSQDAQVSA
jgi:small subunit ribosomal protein S16